MTTVIAVVMIAVPNCVMAGVLNVENVATEQLIVGDEGAGTQGQEGLPGGAEVAAGLLAAAAHLRGRGAEASRPAEIETEAGSETGEGTKRKTERTKIPKTKISKTKISKTKISRTKISRTKREEGTKRKREVIEIKREKEIGTGDGGTGIGTVREREAEAGTGIGGAEMKIGVVVIEIKKKIHNQIIQQQTEGMIVIITTIMIMSLCTSKSWLVCVVLGLDGPKQ